MRIAYKRRRVHIKKESLTVNKHYILEMNTELNIRMSSFNYYFNIIVCVFRFFFLANNITMSFDEKYFEDTNIQKQNT